MRVCVRTPRVGVSATQHLNQLFCVPHSDTQAHSNRSSFKDLQPEDQLKVRDHVVRACHHYSSPGGSDPRILTDIMAKWRMGRKSAQDAIDSVFSSLSNAQQEEVSDITTRNGCQY